MKILNMLQSETSNSIVIFFIFLNLFIRTNKKRKGGCLRLLPEDLSSKI